MINRDILVLPVSIGRYPREPLFLFGCPFTAHKPMFHMRGAFFYRVSYGLIPYSQYTDEIYAGTDLLRYIATNCNEKS